MKKYLRYTALFLVLNFGALALGGALMDSGPVSDWYMGLEKAPWTPPGWVFGFAWTIIMLCFSLYMARLAILSDNKGLWSLYGMQWVLNVSWNYVFFNRHLVGLGLVVLVLLTMLVWAFYFRYRSVMGKFSLLIAPYMIWLVLACSLNAYILLYNPL